MTTATTAKSFFDTTASFSKQVTSAGKHLEAFDLQEELAEVQEALTQEDFRVAVLGRFKAGKSSLVNALIGRDISPTATLACTSSLIEIQHSDEESYTFHDDGESWQKTTRKEFRRASNLQEDGEETAPMRRWRVQLPIRWLGPHFTLIDTPGTDENAERQEAAYSELRRADAAIVVVRADQVGTLEEIEMAEALKARVDLVLVVVNRMDLIPMDERDEIIQFVCDRVGELGVPGHNVLPLSAKRVLSGHPDAVEDLRELRKAVSDVLAGDMAGARLRRTMRQTVSLIKRLEEPIQEKISKADRAVDEAAEVTDKLRGKLGSYESLGDEIQKRLSSQGRKAASSCAKVFEREWPNVVKKLHSRRSRWKSSSNPLFSPKKTAEEIADEAQSNLKELVSDVIGTKLQPKIETITRRFQEQTQQRLQDLLRLASRAGLGSTESIQRQLVEKAMHDAFGETIDKASDDAALAAGVNAAISLVVGYIIADIILFYVLGAIAGFLNPILLAAAAVTGIAAYVFMGKEAVREKLRNKIADKLETELKKKETVNKITKAVRKAVRDQFDKLASEYASQIDRLVELTRDSLTDAEQEHEDLDAELESILVHRRQADAALHDLVDELRNNLDRLQVVQGGIQ